MFFLILLIGDFNISFNGKKNAQMKIYSITGEELIAGNNLTKE
jgi:hypothetical protein